MRTFTTLTAAVASLAFATSASAQATSILATALCTEDQFWYPALTTCLPMGGPSKVDSHKKCPKDWYYFSAKNACAPRYPNSPLPLCPPGHWWDPAHIICKLRCDGPFEFWFAERGQCIQEYAGGFIPAPGGKKCPKNWHYDSNWKTCLPDGDDDQHDPQCPSGYLWSRTTLTCEPQHPIVPPPAPTGGAVNSQRELRRRALEEKHKPKTQCPDKHTTLCPIEGSDEHECVDTQFELRHCGGCSTGPSALAPGAPIRNCNNIPNARNTACDNGCKVISCKHGWKVNATKTACERR